MRFSQRHGYKDVRTVLQRESIDDGLRRGLWNVTYTIVLEHLEDRYAIGNRWRTEYEGPDKDLVRLVWQELGGTLDELPEAEDFSQYVKEVVEDQPWYEVYDLVEALYEHLGRAQMRNKQGLFGELANKVLETGMSAYRLVGGHIVETTSEAEISAIENALTTNHSLVAEHLSRALELLSDREQPDYRNSIKESISAVESLAQTLSGKEKASLKDALNSIDAETHQALAGAFNKLYGWTSDADGIRHAMLEDSKVDQADALFMLVACSAFANYLTAKSAKSAREG